MDALQILTFLAIGIIAGALPTIVLAKRRHTSMANARTAAVEECRALQAQLKQKSDEYSSRLDRLSDAHRVELERLGHERRRLQEEHLSELATKARMAEERGYEEGKRHAELRSEARATALSVVVHPYVRKTQDAGLFKKSTHVEVGYQYQLHVNGIPCFEPHVVVKQKLEEKQVNEETLAKLTAMAIEAARLAVAIHGQGAVAAIPVGESPVVVG